MRFPIGTALLSVVTMLSSAAGETQSVVHILVPGFTVQELPVKLSNLNNLRFAPDGRLTALGYDGRVHLLRDTDGDGLEDEDKLFWDKPTISVPVGMAWSRAGLYVSSNRKISLLRDTNRDGQADVEETIATNWPPTDVGSGSVDATAITLDKRGNIYFGLLTADYSNPYRVKDDVSHYDIHGKRGTIQKLSPDGKKMETIATGIRVPYTLAFNRRGDLFVTDQEGETWCPNGNPLDELNQIIPGRNYGFPPRHERWLPNLVSEAPVVAFGPQHQSTCGLVFNEPEARSGTNPGRKVFGPAWWEGDAFVAGESRGKIWRVRLDRTLRGYTGREFLIARLSMLTTDVAISPKGDLYVCCHSGQPDWGTGPRGAGKIFKISYTDNKAPQPLSTEARFKASKPDGGIATEIHVTFNRPVDVSITSRTAEMRLEFGEFVRAADRLEVLKPPYDAVKRQEASPRGFLKIRSARLEDRSRRLVLEADPIVLAVPHALTLVGVKRPGQSGEGDTVDLDVDMRSVEARLPKPAGVAESVASGASKSPQAEILAGGDFERGRELFTGDRLKCATCHRIRGEGGQVGPDLDTLISRDAAAVLRDIKEPSASINPDFVAYNVNWRDEELTGFIRSHNDIGLRLVGADGKEQVVPRAEIKQLRVSAVSLMPTGLLDGLGEAQVRDLLTFLLHAPPVRTSKEIQAALTPARPQSVAGEKPLSIVLVAGKQDHGPGQHDYPTWQKKWHALLTRARGVTISDAWEWPDAEQFQKANVIVFYFWNQDWNAERLHQLDEFQARGGGVVVLHSATIADKEPEQLALRFGLAAQPGPTKYLHAPFDLKFVAPASHPVTVNLPPHVRLLDEPYWPMFGDTNRIEILASTELEGKEWPMMWTFQAGKGRVFASIPSHYTWTLDDPLFRMLLLRGIAWAGGMEEAQFENLVEPEKVTR
ncbi:MAG: c-type cytochrome [Verrucomicrobia bacterium]|nr:c-type cytochrome [Verrucomicrobiota bacterium]